MAHSLTSDFLHQCKLVGAQPSPALLEELEHSGKDTDPSSHKSVSPTIRLSGQAIDKKTLVALCNVLSTNTFFQRLILSDAYLGDEGTVLLCKALKGNSAIQWLDLRGNAIQKEGALAIASLVQVTLSLQVLILEWNSIGLWDDAMQALGEALSMNTTLHTLDLRNNKIGAYGMQLFCTGLKQNRTLTRIDLRWNNLGRVGGQHVCEVFDSNYILRELDLIGNDVSDQALKSIQARLERNAHHRSESETTERMQHLLQDVQSLHEREVIQLNHTLAAQEKNHQHLTQQWMDAQREVADQQTKVMELQHEVERLHDHHQTLTSQYTSALQQHDTVVSQLHHQETVLRQSLQEWQRKAQLAESQLLSLQTQESKVLGECQVLTQELERRKEQEKRTLARHEEALRQVEKQVQLKIEKLTSLHEEELNTQVTLLQRKYDDLNQLLSKKEREWEDTTRRWEQKKMDLESHYKQALHRVECEEKEKLKNLQRDHHQLQLEKETLQKELDRVTYTAQTSARDLETKSERWQHDRRQWDETHQSFLRQLKDVTLELQKEKDQSKLAQDTVRQVRDEMKGVIESKDRLQREHLQSCQALDQARERVKVLEEVERRRKLDSLEKLRSLEHAFGAYVRDATGSQHHEL